MSEYIIREFREEDLPALAVHCRESVRGWPPGFQMGGDFSPEGVREFLLRSGYIAFWTGWIGDRIVGILKYCRSHEDADCTYVDFLQVHPDWHGTGCGRKLLTTCIDKAVADEVKRVDLHTWPANAKAVPLYKKTGFFWRPRTSHVHMYNFIPPVLRNPLVKAFLGESDWYGSLRQPLEIREDDDLIDGCCYHKYTFEKDAKVMEVLVDPSTSGVVGIISDDLAIRVDIPGLTHPSGLSHPVRWTFRAPIKSPVDVRIDCSADDPLDYSLTEEFQLKGERTIDTAVRIAPHGRPDRIDWYGRPIECRVAIDGADIVLAPGIRVVPPFELATSPWPILLAPGEERRFILTLKSRLTDPVELIPEFKTVGDIDMIESPDTGSIRVLAENSLGIPVVLKARGGSGSGTVEVGGILKLDETETRIQPMRAHAVIAGRGRPVEVPDDDPNVWALSNGVISIKSKRKGGFTSVFEYDTDRLLLDIFYEEIGEPFSREFNTKDYEISVEPVGQAAQMVCKADSRDFPGITLERRIRVSEGYGLDILLSLRNGGDRTFDGKVRFTLPVRDAYKLIVPIGDRVHTGLKDAWVSETFPLPADPTEYAEPWIGLVRPGSWPDESYLTGIVFKGVSRLKWMFWTPLIYEFASGPVDPGETVEFPPLRVILKAHHWRDIQRVALDGAPSHLALSERNFVYAESPIFADTSEPVFSFHVVKTSSAEGSAKVTLPDGRSSEAGRDDWSMSRPIEIRTPALPENSRGIMPVDCEVTLKYVSHKERLPLIVPAPGSKIHIARGREGDYDFYSVDNGCIECRVAPKFGGSLYWLSDKAEPDRNLLRTPFPEPSMWTWFNPWFGGIMPFLSLNFRFHLSEFDGDAVGLDWAGYQWDGVRVTVTPIRDWRSLRFESIYLTRPGYPIILNLLRLTETEGCARHLELNCISFPCPSGDPSAITSGVAEEFGRIMTVSRSPKGTESGAGRWAAICDPATSRAFGVVLNSGNVSVWDAAESGQPLWAYNQLRTEPGRTVEMAAMYVLADNSDQVALLSRSFPYRGRMLAQSEPVVLDIELSKAGIA